MEYSKIIAVTGLPGLYELVSSKSDGAIVRSLDDKTTRFVASRIHNFSHLESIEVYTVRDNVNLAEVLVAMDKKTGSLPNVKDNDAVKTYFQLVYPDMDFSRVYTSDMKKMVKWFETLKQNNIEIKIVEAVEAQEEAAAELVQETKPKKAATPENQAKIVSEPKQQVKTILKEKPPVEETLKVAKPPTKTSAKSKTATTSKNEDEPAAKKSASTTPKKSKPDTKKKK